MYYKGARAIIICFDITNSDSFEGAQNWHTEVFESVKKSVIVLCGTKKDLEQKRQVDFSQAKKFADSKGVKYFETSAKDDFGIQDVFAFIAEQITLENLKKETEGVDLNYLGSAASTKGKKLERAAGGKEKFGYFKMKAKCCGGGA